MDTWKSASFTPVITLNNRALILLNKLIANKGRVGHTGISISRPIHFDTVVTIYSWYLECNIVRKCKVLETNLKSEEISNFYPIVLYILALLVISFRTVMFSFCESYFRLVGLFNWGYTRTQFLLSVSWNRYSFTLAGY